MTEKQIEQYFIEKARYYDGEAFKLVIQGGKFFPDRTLFIFNKIFFVEFKTISGVISQGQRIKFKYLEKLGHPVYIIKSREQVDEFFKSIINNYCNTICQ